jgi:trk system potassium uptake protein TrkH
VILISSFLLCCFEPEVPFVQILMETTSAFATVGLSCGLTPTLSVAGKLVIIITMYIGRLGPLTVATLWIVQSRKHAEILRPEETISVG